MTAGRRLRINVAVNLGGQFLPMVAALAAMPGIIRGLGVERFAVLTLAWALIGFFGLFDFGIGRALTQRVSALLGTGRQDEAPSLAWSGLGLIAAMGVVGGCVMAALAWPAARFLSSEPAIEAQAAQAFRILALGVPLVTLSAGLRAVLEAHQRFGWINLVRVPTGLLGYLGPLAVLALGGGLGQVIGLLVAVRALECLSLAIVNAAVIEGFWAARGFRRTELRSLLGFGGWMTLSNLISPLMVNMDRFIVGRLVSMEAVAYYATPVEVMLRLTAAPFAVMGVLFPAFSRTAAEDRASAGRLFGRAAITMAVVMFLPAALVVLLAPEGLRLWLGPEFSGHSATVLKLIAAGVYVNSVAYVPYGLVQGMGRADWTARFHLIELPVHLLALVGLTLWLGINGAAVAWVLRISLDMALLLGAVRRLLGSSARAGRVLGLTAGNLVLLLTMSLPWPLPSRLAACAVVSLAVMLAGWRWRHQLWPGRPAEQPAEVTIVF